MAFNLIDAIIILFIENDELIKKNKDDLVISNIFKDFWKTYEFLNENVDTMRKGKSKAGSIGPVFNKLCPDGIPRSFLTLDAGGSMTINYPWLKPEYRKKIAESFSENPELKIDYKSRPLLNSDVNLEKEYLKYSRDQWSDNVDSIIEIIRKFI